MNYSHLAIYIVGSAGPITTVCLLQNKLTTGLRRFVAFSAVGAGFAMLNLGPLGPILGGPAILMSAALCSYLARRNQ